MCSKYGLALSNVLVHSISVRAPISSRLLHGTRHVFAVTSIPGTCTSSRFGTLLDTPEPSSLQDPCFTFSDGSYLKVYLVLRVVLCRVSCDRARRSRLLLLSVLGARGHRKGARHLLVEGQVRIGDRDGAPERIAGIFKTDVVQRDLGNATPGGDPLAAVRSNPVLRNQQQRNRSALHGYKSPRGRVLDDDDEASLDPATVASAPGDGVDRHLVRRILLLLEDAGAAEVHRRSVGSLHIGTDRFRLGPFGKGVGGSEGRRKKERRKSSEEKDLHVTWFSFL